MVDSTLPFDFPTWSLDALDAPHTLSLETGIMNEDELQRYQLPNPGYDEVAAQHFLGSGPGPAKVEQQMSAKTDSFYDPLTDYAPVDADNFPIFPQFYHLSKDPLSLDDLLRSTSQVATERALYMNNAALPQHPIPVSPSSLLDPGASPDTSHGSYSASDDGWECHAQMMDLPEAFAPAGASDEDEGLTPLEMPDGSTRFTANWLPVDPQGGFTIGSPEKPRSAAGAGNLFDLEFMNYRKEAFITTDSGV
ncbi:hypothetical protein N8T08_004485 [Aspergillus melleus]|uniref:Uncharacterized protein n=1 Tax=Aspergillus melleus TaxID=138277 RepID=A0ACC3B402_9EURO|nr:hypothetical protein N8T08_004485 [Aspergillus melleus]